MLCTSVENLDVCLTAKYDDGINYVARASSLIFTSLVWRKLFKKAKVVERLASESGEVSRAQRTSSDVMVKHVLNYCVKGSN